MNSSCKGRDVHFLLLHGVPLTPRCPEGCFGQAIVARDMTEPCNLPSLDSCRRMFPVGPRRADHVPHPVVGLVLQAGDAEKFLRALDLESLDPILRISKQGPCLTS